MWDLGMEMKYTDFKFAAAHAALLAIPEVLQAANDVRIDTLPQKSRQLYWSTYTAFIQWKDEKKANITSENVMLAYFGALATKYKPSSLWSKYSLLRSTIKIKHNVDLGDFAQLLGFLKHGFEPKKSNVLTPEDVKKFLRDAPDQIYLVTKVALIFGLRGACRHGELCSLATTDVVDHGKIIQVTLRNTKNKTTRNFVIEGELLGLVKVYRSLRPANATVDRFFLTYRKGKCVNQPLGKNKFGSMPRKIAQFLQLENPERYTGHAFRRSSATLCPDQGCSTMDLKRLGGWKSSTVAEGYVEDCIHQKRKTSRQISDVIAGTSGENTTEQQLKKSKPDTSVDTTLNRQKLSDLISTKSNVSLSIAHTSTMNIHFHN